MCTAPDWPGSAAAATGTSRMRLTEEGVGVDADELLDVADEPVHASFSFRRACVECALGAREDPSSELIAEKTPLRHCETS